MDKNGQLTFSDNPLLNGLNEAYQLIEEGNFSRAVECFDDLLGVDPAYPGIAEGYRTAKFWSNRVKELKGMGYGLKAANFLMTQWETFDEYAAEKGLLSSVSYKSAMKFIFHKASEYYKSAFQNEEDPSANFNLLLNLGSCFLRLEEYKLAIDTLEYARSSHQSNAKLLSILAEAYFHENDIPKSMLYFKEAFFIDPSQIDLNLLKAKPLIEIISTIKESGRQFKDIREWIGVYGIISDVFYTRRNISKNQLENIEKDIYNLEVGFQNMGKEQIEASNVLPSLFSKYLWMIDYYTNQNYNFERISQIRERLLSIDRELFTDYFKKIGKH